MPKLPADFLTAPKDVRARALGELFRALPPADADLAAEGRAKRRRARLRVVRHPSVAAARELVGELQRVTDERRRLAAQAQSDGDLSREGREKRLASLDATYAVTLEVLAGKLDAAMRKLRDDFPAPVPGSEFLGGDPYALARAREWRLFVREAPAEELVATLESVVPFDDGELVRLAAPVLRERLATATDFPLALRARLDAALAAGASEQRLAAEAAADVVRVIRGEVFRVVVALTGGSPDLGMQAWATPVLAQRDADALADLLWPDDEGAELVAGAGVAEDAA